ncbi:AbrB/MazE/SpoVT family DNA-binding domain-containing protein [Oceaniradius stylonematis]|uniref:AbrB/MazE/SpoVT family DNA-binding domain-containing protein n=1 Tax=Oceaniradius stylonematis TaxID=2184161 RepID=A0A3A8AK20_9HYPH|nr:AbrB/MazE/SpoVT family DNA-binding domain-containing protein [Oceaniradius stylonematis]RKF06061.1 AbrB/MazE/SpoVT family DNA-binding domain-containing protein [Oceaniradius stylonematis]
MRVTRKGQVTIPKHIRDKLGITAGSEVEFVDRGDDGVRLRAVEDNAEDRAARFRRWLDQVKGTIDLGEKTVDELMLEMRGPRDDIDAH